MRWFQVDSDTPHDPKMRAVLKAMGPSGFGGLMLLWCHIANHGEKRPGWSLTSSGKPMPESELITASELTADQFAQLVSICTENGHFSAREWNTRKVIAIPAMHARADTYTKRRVRTRDAHASKSVPLQDSTNSTNTEIPPTPRADARRARLTRAQRKHAEEVLRIRFGQCRHEPACLNHEACVIATARELSAKGAA